MLADAKKLGRWGENRCRRYLKSKGYRTIARNFRCALGEIDLIAADGEGRIVFVEVKTRRNEDHAQARLAVDHRKRTRMARAANHFIKTYNVRNKPLRFDVVTVILNAKGPATIRHYENVFSPGR
ncbi:MAG: YraN family protein [Planctomycetes bacterium]|nr:YraN family protein [Planctomycetota bacterium]